MKRIIITLCLGLSLIVKYTYGQQDQNSETVNSESIEIENIFHKLPADSLIRKACGKATDCIECDLLAHLLERKSYTLEEKQKILRPLEEQCAASEAKFNLIMESKNNDTSSEDLSLRLVDLLRKSSSLISTAIDIYQVNSLCNYVNSPNSINEVWRRKRLLTVITILVNKIIRKEISYYISKETIKSECKMLEEIFFELGIKSNK